MAFSLCDNCMTVLSNCQACNLNRTVLSTGTNSAGKTVGAADLLKCWQFALRTAGPLSFYAKLRRV